MNLVLYWHPHSSATPIAHALAALAVPHQRIPVDIHAGEQHAPAYRALHPFGKVPCLTVDGAPLFEALAIHLWLGETFGVERGVWPAAGTPERLQATSWCTWVYVSYGALVVQLQTAKVGEPALRSAALAEAAQAGLGTMLDGLERQLADRPWLLGEHWSLADLVVSAVIGYSAYVGQPLGERPRLLDWLARGQSRLDPGLADA